MPGLIGADVDQLRVLSLRFAEAADRLRDLVTDTSRRVEAACWAGPDADRFRAQWQGEAIARLWSAADALQAAATALQRNADEQEQASAASGGGSGPGPPLPAWGWPGDVGATPWFLRPGGGLPDPGMTPMIPNGNNGTGPQWSFPNPFDEYRDFVGKTPIWPTSIGTAGGQLRQAGFDSHNPAGYLTGVAVSQWGDVVSEFTRADFSQATVANNVDFITAHPGEAFGAARDAVLSYIPKLISNFSFNPFGK